MTVRATGANFKLAGKFEDDYGTPPAGDYFYLSATGWDLGEEQGLIDDDTLGQGREPNDPDDDVINDTGSPTVPVDVRKFGYWLKLLLGPPVSTGAAAATGFYDFSAQPANNATITVNGDVWTFKAAGAVGNQIAIGADLAETLTNTAAALNGSADAQITVATYAVDGTKLTVTMDAMGAA
ncbi:MAG: hypothetical protein JSS35_10675, partial [Proteobacteria bacterium]|nr:hypothetical protein [Pseudomonadota bacterium]